MIEITDDYDSTQYDKHYRRIDMMSFKPFTRVQVYVFFGGQVKFIPVHQRVTSPDVCGPSYKIS